MPPNAFFSTNSAQKTLFFSTLHPIPTVIFATATVLAFVLLRDSRFSFQCYAQREATPTQKSARKCTATSQSRLLARKITKRIHSSKPASLNRPIGTNPWLQKEKEKNYKCETISTVARCVGGGVGGGGTDEWTEQVLITEKMTNVKEFEQFTCEKGRFRNCF